MQNVEPLWRLRPGGSTPYDGPQEWIAFYRPETKERIVGLWARYGNAETAIVPAVASSAKLVTPDGTVAVQTPDQQGNYSLTLPGATNQNSPWDPSLFAIGGRPYLLVETDEQAPATTLQVAPFAVDGKLWATWTGDDGLGAGLQDFSVTVSVDRGQPLPWMTNTQATSGSYQVELGRTYTISLTARDRAGNVSDAREVTVVAAQPAVTINFPLMRR
jgi:hypothetical protein